VNQLQSDFAIKLVNLRAAVRASRLASLALRTRSAFCKPTVTIETSAGHSLERGQVAVDLRGDELDT
jgi:hypothetical protein